MLRVCLYISILCLFSAITSCKEDIPPLESLISPVESKTFRIPPFEKGIVETKSIPTTIMDKKMEWQDKGTLHFDNEDSLTPLPLSQLKIERHKKICTFKQIPINESASPLLAPEIRTLSPPSLYPNSRYNTLQIDMDQGLAGGQVNEIKIDSAHHFYLATYNGLQIIKGEEVFIYSVKQGLKPGITFGTLLDKQNNPYCFYDRGDFSYIDFRQNTVYHFGIPGEDKNLRPIGQMDSIIIFKNQLEQIYLYHAHGRFLEKAILDGQLSNIQFVQPHYICGIKDGQIAQFDLKSREVSLIRVMDKDKNTSDSILLLHDLYQHNYVAISQGNKIIQFQVNGKLTHAHSINQKIKWQGNSKISGNKNHLLSIITQEKQLHLLRLRESKMTSYNYKFPGDINYYHSQMISAQNTVLISTNEGILMHPFKSNAYYFSEESNLNFYPYQILPDGGGNLFIQNSMYIGKIDAMHKVQTTLITNNNFKRLKRNKENQCVILTRDHLIYPKDNYKDIRAVYFEGFTNLKLFEQIEFDSSGTTWLSVGEKGLISWNPRQSDRAHFHAFKNFPKTSIGSMKITKDGYIWLFTKSQGIWVYNPSENSLCKITEKEGLQSSNCYVSFIDKRGQIWFSYIEQGIGIISPEKKSITHLNKKHNLSDNDIFSINESDSLIICGTNQGLSFIQKEFPYKITKLGKRDGMPYYDCNSNSNYLLNKNELLMGTGEILMKIALPSTRPKQNKLQFTYLTYGIHNTFLPLQANDSLLPCGEISYHQNNIDFHFTTGKAFERGKTVYSWFLEGLDKTWHSSNTANNANYAHLPYGNYTFHLLARNEDGSGQIGKRLHFTILPPWYFTWWAKVAYGIMIAGIFYQFSQWRLRVIRKQKKNLENIVDLRTKEIQTQKIEIEQHREALLESINYAKHIQESILEPTEKLQSMAPGSFIFYEPRDIVSGDFYWFYEMPTCKIFICADCTGHGVPGAFVTMIGSLLLKDIIHHRQIHDPGEILNLLHKGINEALRQEEMEAAQEGMDLAIISHYPEDKIIKYAGARSPIYHIKNGQITRYKTSIFPLGGVYQKRSGKLKINFTSESIPIQTGEWIYLCSDGYYDQMGGTDGKQAFGSPSFENLLLHIHSLDPNEQIQTLRQHLIDWQGKLSRYDDVLVMGIKIN